MQAMLDSKDYEVITEEVLKRILAKYDLTPKQQPRNEWVGIKEFTQSLPIIKDKEWVRVYILTRPEFKDWVINLNAGSGHRVRVNQTKGLAWVMDHLNEIDWKQRLPR